MSDRPSEDTFLTVAEVAARVRVSQQTVRNWIARGQLAAVRVGTRRVRVRQVDLDRFLAAEGRPATGAHWTGAPAVDAGMRDRFLDAAFELIRVLAGARSGDLRSALRGLADQAELWADVLE